MVIKWTIMAFTVTCDRVYRNPFN